MGEIIQYWTVNKKAINSMNPLEKKELFIDLVLSAFEFKLKKIENMKTLVKYI